MKIYKNKFSKNLAEALRAAGKRQVDLVDHLHIEPSTVSRWMKGSTLPEPETLEKLAKYFEVTEEQLVGASAESGIVGRSTRPAPRALKQLIEEAGDRLPYGPLSLVLEQFAAEVPAVRAMILATLYDDPSISEPYLRGKASSRVKAR